VEKSSAATFARVLPAPNRVGGALLLTTCVPWSSGAGHGRVRWRSGQALLGHAGPTHEPALPGRPRPACTGQGHLAGSARALTLILDSRTTARITVDQLASQLNGRAIAARASATDKLPRYLRQGCATRRDRRTANDIRPGFSGAREPLTPVGFAKALTERIPITW